MRFLSTVLASVIGGLVAIAIFVFFCLMVLAGLAAIDSGGPVVPEGSVLTVKIRGALPETVQEAPIQLVFEGSARLTLTEVTRAIRHAADDDRIQGLWLQPEAVSASWAALEEIRAAVEAFRRSGKPSVASSSAGGFSERDYFVASAAEYVYSPSQALFEFNGFALVAQFLKGLLDKLGVQAEAVRAGRFKSAVEPFTRDHASDENRRQLQALVDAQARTFLGAVGESRGLSYESLDDLVQATSVIDAEGAYESKLLDALLTPDEVRDVLVDSLLGGGDETKFVDIATYARSVPDIVSGSSPRDAIAVLYAVGTIVEGRSGYDPDPIFGGRRVGSDDLVDALRDVRENDRVKAVVLRIDSPGGSGRASDVIWESVRQTAEVKPVIASLAGVAASGGYYIAAGADSIVADASTITGSIGVFSLLINTSGLLEDKLGITFDAVKTAPTADMFSGLRSLTGFERKILERGVDRMYDRFTMVVAEGRRLSISEVLEIAEGRVWSGMQAREIGLVDRLGSLEDALGTAARLASLDSTGYRILTFPEEKSLIERLWDLAATGSQPGTGFFSYSATSPVTRQIQLLQEMISIHGSVEARMPLTFSID